VQHGSRRWRHYALGDFCHETTTVILPGFLISEDVWADWLATKQEQFGQDWSTVTLILNELARHGIHLLDVSSSNILR